MARNKKTHPEHLNMLFRQLAIMTASGMSVAEALTTLTEEGEGLPARALLKSLRSGLASGKRPGELLAAHFPYLKGLPPELFEKDPALASEFFTSIAEFSEKRQAMSRFLGMIFLYPALVSVLLIAVVGILMVVVVPMMASMFMDMGGVLPLPTRTIIALSQFVSGWGGAGVMLVIAALIWVLKRKKMLRYALLDKVPVLRQLNRKIAGAELVRNMALLVRTGTSGSNAVPLAAHSVTNEYFAGRFTSAARSQKGIADCLAGLRKENLIPAAVSHAARTGERTDTLAAVLQESARYLEQDAEKTYDRFLVLLYPVTILVLGAIVGFCAIAMYMPIFQMGTMAG